MQSVAHYFKLCFQPKSLFKQDDLSKRFLWEILLTHTLLFISIHLMFPANYHGKISLELIFIAGYLLRIFLTPYLLQLGINRLFKLTLSYLQIINCELLCLFVMLPGTTAQMLIPGSFGIPILLAQCYFYVLFSLQLASLTGIHFSRVLVIIFVSHLMLWLVVLPFMGMPFG